MCRRTTRNRTSPLLFSLPLPPLSSPVPRPSTLALDHPPATRRSTLHTSDDKTGHCISRSSPSQTLLSPFSPSVPLANPWTILRPLPLDATTHHHWLRCHTRHDLACRLIHRRRSETLRKDRDQAKKLLAASIRSTSTRPYPGNLPESYLAFFSARIYTYLDHCTALHCAALGILHRYCSQDNSSS